MAPGRGTLAPYLRLIAVRIPSRTGGESRSPESKQADPPLCSELNRPCFFVTKGVQRDTHSVIAVSESARLRGLPGRLLKRRELSGDVGLGEVGRLMMTCAEAPAVCSVAGLCGHGVPRSRVLSVNTFLR